jgi:hypothetical protein
MGFKSLVFEVVASSKKKKDLPQRHRGKIATEPKEAGSWGGDAVSR